MKPETVLKHAQAFYAALVERSTPLILDNEEAQIFTGSVTKIFTIECELPLSYYTPVKQFLDDFDCLQIVERGTRNRESVVRLLRPPPTELPASFVKSLSDPLTDRAELAKLRGEVQGLKAWRESQKGIVLIDTLRNMEHRLVKIENMLGIHNNNEIGEKI